MAARKTSNLAALVAVGGKVVLPPGRHVLVEPLRIERATTLTGKGATLVAAKKKHALLVASTAPVTITELTVEASDVAAILIGEGDVTVRRCRFRGPGKTKKGDASAVCVKRGKLTVESARVEAFDSGISYEEKGTGTVRDLIVVDCDQGVYVGSGARVELRGVSAQKSRVGVVFHAGGGGTLEASTFVECAEGGAIVVDGVDVTIANSQFKKSNINVACKKPSRVSIIGNRIEDSADDGIYVGGATIAEVAGNAVVRSGEDGICFTEKATGVVRHNYVAESGATGIGLDRGAAPIVRDNISLRNTYAGVFADDGPIRTIAFNLAIGNENGIYVRSPALVSRNDLLENRVDGVVVGGASTALVKHNHASYNDANGVTTSDKSAPTVADNWLHANELNGVYACDACRPKVLRNTAFSNGCDGFRLDDRSAAVLEGNIALENNEDGISILKKARPTVRGNRCDANEDAAILVVGSACKPRFGKNVLKANGEDQIVRVKGGR